VKDARIEDLTQRDREKREDTENACRTSAGFSATARVSGGVYIEERSFVAKGAPLDDGQKRLGGWTGRLGEADRSVKGAGWVEG
jgi:hypothetical protein